mmetsp:Transcript_47911/g.35124  ORF Transcript_47911/g.35124 Transcript_47911/m.35124 type:complete len:128 (+) Transcript_47911:680-1063(+)
MLKKRKTTFPEAILTFQNRIHNKNNMPKAEKEGQEEEAITAEVKLEVEVEVETVEAIMVEAMPMGAKIIPINKMRLGSEVAVEENQAVQVAESTIQIGRKTTDLGRNLTTSCVVWMTAGTTQVGFDN